MSDKRVSKVQALPPELNRTLGAASSIILTLSIVTPASSVFILIPSVISAAGTGAVYSLAIAALLGLIMALIYSELASAFPYAGGEYVICRRILGNASGFTAFLVNAVVMIFTSSVLALGAGEYLSEISPFDAKTSALIVILSATMISVLNIQLTSWITGVFLSIEALCIFYVSLLGMHHATQPLDIFLHPEVLNKNGILVSASMLSIGFASTAALFSFDGYEQAIYVSEEIKHVRNKIGSIILISLIIGVVAEIVPTYYLLKSARSLNNTLDSDRPFLDMVSEFGGIYARKSISAGIVLSVLNACVVNILMTARFFYSSGRDGFWTIDLNAALATVGERERTPWIAALMVGLASVPICLFFSITELNVITGTALLATFSLLCIALIAGRYSGATANAQFRMPFFPVLPVLGLIAFVGIFCGSWSDTDIGRPSVEFTIGIILTSLILYALYFKKKLGVTPEYIKINPDDS